MTLARKLGMRSEAYDTIRREIHFCICYFVPEPEWFCRMTNTKFDWLLNCSLFQKPIKCRIRDNSSITKIRHSSITNVAPPRNDPHKVI